MSTLRFDTTLLLACHNTMQTKMLLHQPQIDINSSINCLISLVFSGHNLHTFTHNNDDNNLMLLLSADIVDEDKVHDDSESDPG